MTTETVRVLIACGLFVMLFILRTDAARFGAAEYDESGPWRDGGQGGGPRGASRAAGSTGPWTRASWYAIGFGFLAAIYYVHPAPHDVLYLLIGRAADVLGYGALLAAVGLAQAAAFARLRYGHFRLPPVEAYPGAAVNSMATAVIDEAAFRGALLGSLLWVGLPDAGSIILAAIVYVLATRLAAPGHSSYAVTLAAGTGLACGWATVASGGLGAAIIGHAVTSFGVFVFTSHAGQVPPVGSEPEEVEASRRPPWGWQDVRWLAALRRGPDPADFGEPPARAGFIDGPSRRKREVRHSPGRMRWARATGYRPARHSERREP